MLKNISSSGKYMYVHGGNASTYINHHNGSQGVGNVRYNTTNQNLEVYDGNNWVMINMDYAQIGLNSEAEALLDWASKKRDEEMAWKNLAKDNKAVKLALENLEQARQQLEITAKLARDHEQTTY